MEFALKVVMVEVVEGLNMVNLLDLIINFPNVNLDVQIYISKKKIKNCDIFCKKNTYIIFLVFSKTSYTFYRIGV